MDAQSLWVVDSVAGAGQDYEQDAEGTGGAGGGSVDDGRREVTTNRSGSFLLGSAEPFERFLQVPSVLRIRPASVILARS
jgi:hypothetical protein